MSVLGKARQRERCASSVEIHRKADISLRATKNLAIESHRHQLRSCEELQGNHQGRWQGCWFPESRVIEGKIGIMKAAYGVEQEY